MVQRFQDGGAAAIVDDAATQTVRATSGRIADITGPGGAFGMFVLESGRKEDFRITVPIGELGPEAQSKASGFDAVRTKIKLRGVQGPKADEAVDAFSTNIKRTIGSLGEKLLSDPPKFKFTSDIANTILDKTITRQGIGRLFESALQAIVSRTVGVTTVGTSNQPFDFAPSASTGLKRVFGDDVSGLFGDAKIGDTAKSRISMVNKAVAQFGLSPGLVTRQSLTRKAPQTARAQPFALGGEVQRFQNGSAEGIRRRLFAKPSESAEDAPPFNINNPTVDEEDLIRVRGNLPDRFAQNRRTRLKGVTDFFKTRKLPGISNTLFIPHDINPTDKIGAVFNAAAGNRGIKASSNKPITTVFSKQTAELLQPLGYENVSTLLTQHVLLADATLNYLNNVESKIGGALAGIAGPNAPEVKLNKNQIASISGPVFQSFVAGLSTGSIATGIGQEGSEAPFDFIGKPNATAPINELVSPRPIQANLWDTRRQLQGSKVDDLPRKYVNHYILTNPGVFAGFAEKRKAQIEAAIPKVLPAEALPKIVDADKNLPKLASGGSVSDTVPALLTPGEFVINKGAAQNIGYGALAHMNRTGVARFQTGGEVGQPATPKRKRAYVFDFDQTLAAPSPEDQSRIDALKATPGASREAFAAAYLDTGTLERSRPTVLASLARKRAAEGHEVYVLTARTSGKDLSLQKGIEAFLQSQQIPARGVITAGDRRDITEPNARGTGQKQASAAVKKRVILQELAAQYDEIRFFDDNVENILQAKAAGPSVKAITVRSSRQRTFAEGGPVQYFPTGGIVDPEGAPTARLTGTTRAFRALNPERILRALSVIEKRTGVAFRKFLTEISVTRDVSDNAEGELVRQTSAIKLNRGFVQERSLRDIAQLLGHEIGHRADEILSGTTGNIAVTQASRRKDSLAARVVKRYRPAVAARFAEESDDLQAFAYRTTPEEVFAEAFGDFASGRLGKLDPKLNAFFRARIVPALQAAAKQQAAAGRLTAPQAEAQDRRQIFGFARGGFVGGSGNSDSIPAMLTPGEFVLNKSAAQSAGYGALEHFNSGGAVGVQRFQTGGGVQFADFIEQQRGAGTNIPRLLQRLEDSIAKQIRALDPAISAANAQAKAAQTILRLEQDAIRLRQIESKQRQLAILQQDRINRLAVAQERERTAFGAARAPARATRESAERKLASVDAFIKKLEGEAVAIRTKGEVITGGRRGNVPLGLGQFGAAGAPQQGPGIRDRLAQFGPTSALLLTPFLGQIGDSIAGELKDAVGVREERFGLGKGISSGITTSTVGATIGGTLFGAGGAGVGAVAGAAVGFVQGIKEAEREIRDVKISNALQNVTDTVQKFATSGLEVNFQNISRVIESLDTLSQQQRTKDIEASTKGIVDNILSPFSDTRLREGEFKSRAERSQRELFGPQLPSIVQFLNKEAEKIGRSNIGNNLLVIQKTLQQGNSGLNARLLKIIADINKTSVGDELNKFAKTAQTARRNLEAAIDTRRVVNNFQQMADAVSSVSLSMQDFVNASQGFADAISGQISAIKPTGLTERIKQIGSPDPTLARQGISAATQPLGIAGRALADTANAVNDLERLLPNVLANALTAGLAEGQDAEVRIREGLAAGLGGRVNPAQRTLLESVLAQVRAQTKEGPNQLLDKARGDVSGLVRELTKDFEPIRQVLNSIAGDFDKSLGSFIDSLNAYNRNLQVINQERARTGNLELEAIRNRARREAELAGTPGAVRLPLETLLRPGQQAQERLTASAGLRGEAAFNPQAIAQALSAAQTRVQEAIRNQEAARGVPGVRGANINAAAEALRQVQLQANNLQQALKNVADASNRLAAIDDRLAQLRGNRQSRVSFAERFARAGFEERGRLGRGAALTTGLIKNEFKGLETFTQDQIGEVLDFLSDENTLIRTGGGGELRKGDVKNKILEAFRPGGVPLALPNKPQLAEEAGLEGGRQQVVDQAAEASRLLANSLAQANDRFYASALQAQDVFFARLEAQFKQIEVAGATQEIINKRAGSDELARLDPLRKILERAGISKQSQIDTLKNVDVQKAIASLVENTRAAQERVTGPKIETRLKELDTLNKSVVTNDLAGARGLPATSPVLARQAATIQTLGITQPEHEVQARLEQDFGFSGEQIQRVLQNFQKNIVEQFERTEDPTTGRAIGERGTDIQRALATPGVKADAINKALAEAFRQAVRGELGKDAETIAIRERRDAAGKTIAAAGLDVGRIQQVAQADKGEGLLKAITAFSTGTITLDAFNLKVEASSAEIARLEANLKILNEQLQKANQRAEEAKRPIPAQPAGGVATGGPIAFLRKGTDTVPAMLTPGEYVINRASAQANVGLLDKINSAKGPVYLQRGGEVGAAAATTGFSVAALIKYLRGKKVPAPAATASPTFGDVSRGNFPVSRPRPGVAKPPVVTRFSGADIRAIAETTGTTEDYVRKAITASQRRITGKEVETLKQAAKLAPNRPATATTAPIEALTQTRSGTTLAQRGLTGARGAGRIAGKAASILKAAEPLLVINPVAYTGAAAVDIVAQGGQFTEEKQRQLQDTEQRQLSIGTGSEESRKIAALQAKVSRLASDDLKANSLRSFINAQVAGDVSTREAVQAAVGDNAVAAGIFAPLLPAKLFYNFLSAQAGRAAGSDVIQQEKNELNAGSAKYLRLAGEQRYLTQAANANPNASKEEVQRTAESLAIRDSVRTADSNVLKEGVLPAQQARAIAVGQDLRSFEYIRPQDIGDIRGRYSFGAKQQAATVGDRQYNVQDQTKLETEFLSKLNEAFKNIDKGAETPDLTKDQKKDAYKRSLIGEYDTLADNLTQERKTRAEGLNSTDFGLFEAELNRRKQDYLILKNKETGEFVLKAGSAFAEYPGFELEQRVNTFVDSVRGINLNALDAYGLLNKKTLDSIVNPAKPEGFAFGGLAKGTDTVPAMLTPGEFIVNRASAQANGGLLNKINQARGPVYLQRGGRLDPKRRALQDVVNEITQNPGGRTAEEQAFFGAREGVRQQQEALISGRIGRKNQLEALLAEPELDVSNIRSNTTRVDRFQIGKQIADIDKSLKAANSEVTVAQKRVEFLNNEESKNTLRQYEELAQGLASRRAQLQQTLSNPDAPISSEVVPLGNADIRAREEAAASDASRRQRAQAELAPFQAARAAAGAPEGFDRKFFGGDPRLLEFQREAAGANAVEGLRQRAGATNLIQRQGAAQQTRLLQERGLGLQAEQSARQTQDLDIQARALSAREAAGRPGGFKAEALRDELFIRPALEQRKKFFDAQQAKRLRGQPQVGFRPRGFATGGPVSGSGIRDTVPSLLTPGEFVLNRRAVSQIGHEALENVNRFAKGGLVYAQGGTPGGVREVTNNPVTGLQVPPELMAAFERFNASSLELANSLNRSVGDMQSAFNSFGGAVDKLSNAISSFPSNIQMQATHRVEVVHSGTEFLSRLDDRIGEIALAKTEEALSRYADKLGPDAPRPNLDNTSSFEVV